MVLFNGRRRHEKAEVQPSEGIHQSMPHGLPRPPYYMRIREEYPNISLGTVYRNLNLLVEIGEIQKLCCGDGADHFDGDITPHYHFVCHRCGVVSDLPMPVAEEMNTLASRYTDGIIDSHLTYFYGVCENCLEEEDKKNLSTAS